MNDFYERVLSDPQLAPYFEEVDLAHLKRHRLLLISQVLGDPANYDGRALDQAHAGLGISHDDLAAVSRLPLAFSYLWDRMGFWYGQRRLRLIGRSRMQAMFSLVRRSRRPA